MIKYINDENEYVRRKARFAIETLLVDYNHIGVIHRIAGKKG
ncbi:hypothetical protein ACFQ4Y_14125 [Kroppenstedtia sanguinis]|uniref:HEAT repeat domain-containing protein n=1 Tax=Kroppenstedtia sanguinis TaxID=1380684 RepID=A0ABW4CE48_9BACL